MKRHRPVPLPIAVVVLAAHGLIGACESADADAAVRTDASVTEVDAQSGAPPAVSTFRTDGCDAGEDGCEHRVGPESPSAPVEPSPELREFFVDATAAMGGDGTTPRPFRRVGEALAAAAGADARIRVAAGHYAEALVVEPGGRRWSIEGAGVERTLLDVPAGETGVGVTGTGALRVVGLSVVGGRIGLWVGLPEIEVVDSAFEGASGAGVVLRGVADARLERVRIRTADGASAHVLVQDAVARLHAVEVGPGTAPGILAGPGETTRTACSVPEVCPFAAVVDLSESWLHDLGGRGLELQQSRFRVHASRIEQVGAADDTGAGVLALQSFGVFDEGAVVAGVAGTAVALQSSRVQLRDLRLADAVEGLRVERATAPWPIGEGETDWHPGWEWSPVAGIDWHPGWEWQPRDEGLPDEASLPPPLRRGAETPHPALDLHRWARVEGDRVAVRGARSAGIVLTDHVTRLRDVSVGETSAPDSAAIRIAQTLVLPLTDAESVLVGLSRIDRATLTDNAGTGVRVSRVALVADLEVQNERIVAAWPGVTPADGGPIVGRLGLFDVGIQRNGGPGIVLVEAVADVGGAHVEGVQGVGLWSAGALARLVGNQITDVTDAPARRLYGDGLVLSTGQLWNGVAEYFLEARDNSVSGARRAGLLVDDQDGALRGRLIRGVGGFAGRTTNTALVGSGARLDVEGIEFETFTAEALPPPTPPAD